MSVKKKDVPAKKRNGPSRTALIVIIFVVAIIMISAFAIFLTNQTPTISTPSPSSFTPTNWMSFIPANVAALRFLNMSFLNNYTYIFGTPTILSTDQSPVNLTVYDLTYLVAMQTSTGASINVLGLNTTTYDGISGAFVSSNLTTDSYSNVTLYRLENTTTVGPAWVCFMRGALVLAQGSADAEQALQSVIDATPTSFFSTDSLKVGYLLTVSTGPCIVFSYYLPGSNTLNVDWEMHSAANGSSIIVRDSFHFPTVADLNSNFNAAKSELFYSGATFYTSGSFMIGDTIYPISEMRTVLASI